MNRSTRKQIEKVISAGLFWLIGFVIVVALIREVIDFWKIQFCRWYVSWVYRDSVTEVQSLKLWDYCAVTDGWDYVQVLIKFNK